MKKLLVLAAFLLLLGASPAFAQNATSAAGHWKGAWTSLSGFIFSADMTLEKGSDNALRGKIVWTLKQRTARARTTPKRKA